MITYLISDLIFKFFLEYLVEVMDMSFARQSLMSEYIVKNKDSLKPGMVDVPTDIDDKVGILKLQSMGVKIDVLTEDQYN